MQQKHCFGRSFLILILLTCLGVTPAFSAPNFVSYQGLLKDAGGNSVVGSVDMSFAVYDAETVGNLLWAEDHAGVELYDGIYHVMLGDGTLASGSPSGSFDANLFSGDDRWLEVVADSEVFSPRIKFTSAAFSLNADTVDGLHAADLSAEIDGDITVHAGNSAAHHQPVLMWADTDTTLGGTSKTNSAPVEINTVSINLPVAGYIIISGMTFVNNQDASAVSYTLNPLVDGAPYSVDFVAYFASAANNAGVAENFTLSYTITVPITAGSHTVSQKLGTSGGTCSFFYNRNNLTVLFIPGSQGSFTPAIMPAGAEASSSTTGK